MQQAQSNGLRGDPPRLKANQVRMDRARDKRAIAAGRKDAVEILRDPPDHWRSAKVIDLLVQIPRIGPTKALKWLKIEEISESRRIETMTKRERIALARHVETWSHRRARPVRSTEHEAA